MVGWWFIETAPKTGPVVDIEVQMHDGSRCIAHWAYGGGEDQPRFGPAWFTPVIGANGLVSYYREILTPDLWRPC